METKVELERKWLLKKCPDWVQENCVDDLFIEQFYTEDGWRYRFTRQVNSQKGRYEKLKKVSVERGVNHEIDTQKIKKAEYDEEREKAVKIIGKNRMVVEHGDITIEVDDFHDLDLVVMEVEGLTIHDTIVFPEQVEKDILMEVTGNPKFSNFNLAEEPDNDDDSWMNDNDDDND